MEIWIPVQIQTSDNLFAPLWGKVPEVEIFLYCSSAGVGRTGAFIAIDSQLDKAKKDGEVDVLKYVLEMRMDRIKMVQTEVSNVCHMLVKWFHFIIMFHITTKMASWSSETAPPSDKLN